MKGNVKNVIKAFMSEYVDPLKRDMYPDRQQQYYPDQELTYTDLTQMDTTHDTMPFDERYKFVYPDQWDNSSWAGGNFLSPYENDLTKMFRTPNEDTLLHSDLGLMKASAVDSFFSSGGEIIKISSAMDLTEFMKLSDDTLIHKSTKDLWKVFKNENNDICIKRLFDNDLISD